MNGSFVFVSFAAFLAGCGVESGVDYVPNVKRAVPIDYALSNSFGFGGTNAALLFKRIDA